MTPEPVLEYAALLADQGLQRSPPCLTAPGKLMRSEVASTIWPGAIAAWWWPRRTSPGPGDHQVLLRGRRRGSLDRKGAPLNTPGRRAGFLTILIAAALSAGGFIGPVRARRLPRPSCPTWTPCRSSQSRTPPRVSRLEVSVDRFQDSKFDWTTEPPAAAGPASGRGRWRLFSSACPY